MTSCGKGSVAQHLVASLCHAVLKLSPGKGSTTAAAKGSLLLGSATKSRPYRLHLFVLDKKQTRILRACHGRNAASVSASTMTCMWDAWVARPLVGCGAGCGADAAAAAAAAVGRGSSRLSCHLSIVRYLKEEILASVREKRGSREGSQRRKKLWNRRRRDRRRVTDRPLPLRSPGGLALFQRFIRRLASKP